MAALRRFRERLRGPGAWRMWSGMILLLLLVAYVVYMLTRGGLPEIDLRELFARIHPADVALFALIYGANLALAIGAWALIIGTVSGCWRWIEHVRIYCITTITRRLPGTFWYLLGRVVLYERLGVPRGLTAVAGGLEFVAMILAGILVTLVTWPLVLGGTALDPRALLATLAVCALLLNPPLVRSLIRRFGRAGGAAPVRYRQVLLWVGVFAVVWAVGGLQLYVIVRAVAPLPPSALPAMIGVWSATGVVATVFFSFLPFGLGATEVTLASLLSPFVPPAEALVIALVMRVMLTLSEIAYGLLGGLMYLPDLAARRGPFAPAAEEDPHQEAVDSEEVLGAAPGIPPK
jgi:hypothetical protein